MSTWCRHRTPFTSEFKTCKIGVDFHKFPRQHDLMPCLGQTAEAKALCPKYSGYTSEEIEAHEKSLAESLDRMAIIRQAIIANVKATGQRQGRIPCPACVRAEYNFHLGPKAYRGDTQDMLLEAEKQLRQALTGKRQLERAYEKLKQGTR
jgi:hypothetical protein